MPMDNVTFKLIERAFKKFDKSTAYSCRSRKVPFDLARCKETWNAYNQVLLSVGSTIVTNTPIGLE